ncbi:unnamed protein product [Lota lota]
MSEQGPSRARDHYSADTAHAHQEEPMPESPWSSRVGGAPDHMTGNGVGNVRGDRLQHGGGRVSAEVPERTKSWLHFFIGTHFLAVVLQFMRFKPDDGCRGVQTGALYLAITTPIQISRDAEHRGHYLTLHLHPSHIQTPDVMRRRAGRSLPRRRLGRSREAEGEKRG